MRRLRLGLRQIASLTNFEKSMVYFSRNCSSPQGAEATSYIQETLGAIYNFYVIFEHRPSMGDQMRCIMDKKIEYVLRYAGSKRGVIFDISLSSILFIVGCYFLFFRNIDKPLLIALIGCEFLLLLFVFLRTKNNSHEVLLGVNKTNETFYKLFRDRKSENLEFEIPISKIVKVVIIGQTKYYTENTSFEFDVCLFLLGGEKVLLKTTTNNIEAKYFAEKIGKMLDVKLSVKNLR